MARAAILGEVGENFTHHTAKFEAMAGKTTGDEDIGRIRVGVNQEIPRSLLRGYLAKGRV